MNTSIPWYVTEKRQRRKEKLETAIQALNNVLCDLQYSDDESSDYRKIQDTREILKLQRNAL